ncbi:DPY30 domain-containing protein 1 isoform X2 [Phascolarctos cinereus]|nr:DPY30 domain-containing protein 1 isoform X2 [Phascolarctos cinereus]XP_020833007.1 DPY30 domain-containing protein 1 isoform X2 [Phascolarctos cinereus]XP_020833008.1 DPY30 domain-containing protein 1 isoform X2 [Phascolarctos cinereus]XP_020833009.1 DPY30 domain-containing protein 1 isoform X2 [Phascolarctos cinereus]XP_020833010.1 DPY30 domain-containing protein 1 isoform X2 [Phascolarctos cinereus]XP_020833011.1 DPY30 domain-containing protein 1 isoform X2 [Phascolarctos cinereus]XP_02
MESRYLRKFLGQCLSQALADVVKFQPVDPIEYLAFWLYKYKKNMVAEKMRQMELTQLQGEQELARIEEETSKQLKEEELLFQQQQLELEMQEKERQRLEELEKQKLDMEMQERERLFLEQLEEPESSQVEQSGEEEHVAEIPIEVDGLNKTLAEISNKYGAPNLSRVEELDETTISEAGLESDRDGKEQ